MTAAVNPFVDIQLSLIDNDVKIQYRIDPQFTGRAPYTIKLFAYEDDTFTAPLYVIENTDNNACFIVDDTNIRQNQLASFLYKLSLTTKDNATYLSNFFGWHPSDSESRHKYLLANDIARRERVRFNYTGLWAYLLKRKNYSPAANNNVDPITGEPLTDNTTDFGAGIDGGYYSPILTRLSIEQREAKTTFDQGGRGSQYSEMLKVRSVGFPFIDQHDLIVTPDSKRFIVADADTKYFPGTTMIILQQPTLRLIPGSDTVYSITIPNFPDERK